ncbi:MAG: ADP-ribose pyrophosphatase [Clostridia bacterium]|nr:ADP-ribose pyrophosphatase [Clostridia bacterium]
MDHLKETCLDSRRIYEGKILNLRCDRVLLPGGREATREVVEHPGAVTIVALDSEDNVYLVRQFRYPVGEVTLELPAGKLDCGEEAEACARRELAEEAGLKARSWRHLLNFYTTPGFSTEIMYLFLAQELSREEAEADADEFLEVEKVPLAEAVQMALEGKIRDAKSIVGILAAYLILRSGNKETCNAGR